jgi:hypothetical protein
MERMIIKQVTEKILLATVLFICGPVAAGAANHYVRAGATGNGSGSDWTNAYADLPSSLVRGDIYYFGAGSYGAHNFNDSDFGTLVITIQAATIANHGTSTGWNNAYQGQALFQCGAGCTPISFGTDYYVINGVYCAVNVTYPQVCASGEGLHFHFTGAGSPAAVTGANVHDISIMYVDAEGNHPLSDAANPGYVFDFEQGSWNLFFDHVRPHDGYTNFFLKGNHDHPGGGGGFGPGTNITIQYSVLSHVYDSNNFHGELCSCDEGLVDFTMRYNLLLDPVNRNGGTAFLGTASGGNPTDCTTNCNGPWYIYGNITYCTNPGAPYGCSVGDGTWDLFGIRFGGDVWIVNNTGAMAGSGASGVSLGLGWPVNMQNVFVENNVWHNAAGFNDGCVGSCTIVSRTVDYNSLYQFPDGSQVNEPGAHSTYNASSNPFVNASAFDFHLASHTPAGVTLSNIGTYWNGSALVANTFDKDMNGTTRPAGAWDRGAFQFPGTGSLPNPPTKLAATVN